MNDIESVLASLKKQQESYPMGIITDAIQAIQLLRIANDQLEGQIKIKDLQIAELKKQTSSPTPNRKKKPCQQ